MKGQFIAKLRSAKKTPKVTSVSEKIHILQGNGFVWKDLQNPDRSKLEELQKEHGLNALNVEDCLTKFELPKLDSYDSILSIGSIYKHSQLFRTDKRISKDWQVFKIRMIKYLPCCSTYSMQKNTGSDLYE